MNSSAKSGVKEIGSVNGAAGKLPPLPPCGMWVGSGIYGMSKDYLLCVMTGHQSWMPQRFHPLEMIDKIIEDNQGNLAQVWGFMRGYAASTHAEWVYALDEIGIDVADPDWAALAGIDYRKDPNIAAHPERRGAGFLRFMKAAAAKGLYTTFIYTDSTDEWVERFSEARGFYLGYDFGERFTFSLESPALRGKKRNEITLQELAEDLIARVREHVGAKRSQGWGPIMATSSNFHIDYEIEAGTDIPMVEDFAFCHLNLASALSRGLHYQHDLQTWGSHLAHEHYSWIPNSSPWKFPLLRAALFQKYMAGSKIIVNESGNWFVEATLCEDSPRHDFPRVPLKPSEVSWGGGQAPKFVPYIEEARRYYGGINYGSPVCRRYRREISDFYDFVKANGTPSGQPEATLALVKGRYDLCCHRYMPNYAIASASSLADEDVRWYEGVPERGWELARQVFFPLRPVLGPYPNLHISGTPYGMVDVVSLIQEDISAESLLARYPALIFTGWNSATERQYDMQLAYVRGGGRLFISIPQLSRNVTRNYTSYGVEELVNGGDFSELCGVRVKGRGPRFYWAMPPAGNHTLGVSFPRRFGILAVSRGEIEIVDSEAETLLVDDEVGYPLLIRHKCGAGEVYFLNSWAYPGAWEQDDGPGGRLGSSGLIGYVMRHIARLSRGDVWISDDGMDPGTNCDYIAFSHFREAGRICLQNVDFNSPRSFKLHRFGKTEEVTLAPAEFRLLDAVTGNMQASDPGGEMVGVSSPQYPI